MLGMFRRIYKRPKNYCRGPENASTKKNQLSTQFGYAFKVARNSEERLKEKTAYQLKNEYEKAIQRFADGKLTGKNNDLLKSVGKFK